MTKLESIAADPRLAETRIWGLNPASSLAQIAALVLKAEIAATGKQTDTAVAALEQAIAIEDGLIYGEPPDWFYPARQNLGAVLLEGDRPQEAEKV